MTIPVNDLQSIIDEITELYLTTYNISTDIDYLLELFCIWMTDSNDSSVNQYEWQDSDCKVVGYDVVNSTLTITTNHMTVFTTEEREFTVIEEESSEMDLEDEAEECVKVEDDDFVSYWQAGLLFAFFFPIPIFI